MRCECCGVKDRCTCSKEYDQAQLDAAVAKAVEAEREACAKIADDCELRSGAGTGTQVLRAFRDGFNTGAADASTHIAESILARGGKT